MSIKAIVTDIEGTTSSISFVKNVLFPYARRKLSDFVYRHENEIAGILEDVCKIENDFALTTDQIIAVLLRWADEDKKMTPLKALQGMIWKAGYEAGDFSGHIYDDAVEAIEKWHDEGIALYIYSSGSVPAQKLLFGYTERGDLTPFFSGFFDTTTGPKLEAESYKKIAAATGFKPAEILFLSDNTGELDAALKAGMQVILLDRDNEQPNSKYKTAKTFDDIHVKEMAA